MASELRPEWQEGSIAKRWPPWPWWRKDSSCHIHSANPAAMQRQVVYTHEMQPSQQPLRRYSSIPVLHMKEQKHRKARLPWPRSHSCNWWKLCKNQETWLQSPGFCQCLSRTGWGKVCIFQVGRSIHVKGKRHKKAGLAKESPMWVQNWPRGHGPGRGQPDLFLPGSVRMACLHLHAQNQYPDVEISAAQS